jgi:hypothetical protein
LEAVQDEDEDEEFILREDDDDEDDDEGNDEDEFKDNEADYDVREDPSATKRINWRRDKEVEMQNLWYLQKEERYGKVGEFNITRKVIPGTSIGKTLSSVMQGIDTP